MKKNIIFAFIILTIFACTTVTVHKSVQFNSFCNNWQNFKWQGYIEINYKHYAFRKNCVLRKNEKAMRLDIFDGGVMGLAPAPFFSFYIDKDITQVKNLDTGKIDCFKTTEFEKKTKLSFFKLMNVNYFLKNKNNLSKKVEYENLTLFLNNLGLIQKVKFDDFLLLFNWRLNKLSTLQFWEKSTKKGEFEINKEIYKKQKINKLKGN